MPPAKQRIAVILGTRPEAIKCAPLILALRRSKLLEPWVVSTAQHRDLVDLIFSHFGIRVDERLSVMRSGSSLAGLTIRLMRGLDALLERQEGRLSAVLVQGDTTTSFVAGLCAFYHRLPVGHVEAGLRTFNLDNPFPEEANRALLTRISRWHFAPTKLAAERLEREGVSPKSIHVVGNTIADALQFMGDKISPPKPDRSMKKIVVTCHRRENWGKPLLGILRAIRRIVREHPEVRVIFPTHPNPRVHRVVRRELQGLDRVTCLPPVDYPVFIGHLKTCNLVLTDSGGVHEEAAMLGKPVILLRSCTERSEGLIYPLRQMAGSNVKTICSLVSRQLTHPFSKSELGQVRSAFGIKGASQRIVDQLEKNRN